MKDFSKGIKKSKKYKQDFEDLLIEKQKERITNLQKENERYKNIIDELEKYINDTTCWYVDLAYSRSNNQPLVFVKDLRNKLKELKGE